ncbi:S-adenosyl-L-methionine-dependent tRNA 4-demethylwyosine synthase-like protein, partial [Dinothrombium tinctorium]
SGARCCEQANDECVILFCTQTGNAKRIAEGLQQSLSADQKFCKQTRLFNIKHFDPDDNFTRFSNSCCNRITLIIIISTYIDGQSPDDGKWFCKWLQEAAHDFRVDKNLLNKIHFAIFGLGNSEYNDNFCLIAKQIESWFIKLNAIKLIDTGCGDETSFMSLDEQFALWRSKLLNKFINSNNERHETQTMVNDVRESESDVESPNENLVDIEDLMISRKIKENSDGKAKKEMITPQLRKELTKQGYKLIGTHSGVKMCRWTKSMLRGRGGCYKHTFYGIESHRCMEATPSLACANKCVFCWRHHTNPVGTEWKWEMDPPEMIVEEAIKNHCKMIKEFKGVPGVLPERFEEGLQIKHCALSLVGEPIMYPQINKIIRFLHERKISTFLVTNAQFPQAIQELDPVTQLYVSVDASSKESLKRIDRPLFKDFWQRFLDSLKALSSKRQRTVYRLTLVKSWNNEELEGYAKLISIGKPDFIEIKGVTYCGSSKGSNLTMNNVPWHEEVVNFVKLLTNYIDSDYEIASEHEHSNCVLVANKRFKVDGQWKTWIDYEKFHDLIKKFYETGETFEATDYMTDLPDWAVYGSNEQGS